MKKMKYFTPSIVCLNEIIHGELVFICIGKEKKTQFFFTFPIVKISHSFPDYTCNDDGKNKWHFQFNR